MTSISMYSGQTKVYHITYSREYGICSLFFWGCNLRCRICLLQKEVYDCHLAENRSRLYDPRYASAPPEQFLSLDRLLRMLEALPIKKAFLMGAEATCDPFFPEVLRYLKDSRRSFTHLLTNGINQVPPSLLDEVVFSIKAVTPDLHRDYTGRDSETILRHFKALAVEKQVSLRAETVFIPDYVDEDEIMKIAAFISSVDRSIPLRIDAYLPMPGLPWRPPEIQELERLCEKVKTILPHTTCLHGDGGHKELAYKIEKIF